MKKAKILIGISMIVALVAAMFVFSASAAPMSLKVTVDKTAIEEGDTLTATVAVNNYETALAGFAVTINYDSAALTLTNVSPVAYGGEVVIDPEDLANADGKVTLVWMTMEDAGMVNVSKLADLTFTAKAADDSVGITAGFKADSVTLPGPNGSIPEAVEPGDSTFTDAPAAAPEIEVVPEGSLGGEDPVVPPAGNGSANAESATKDGYSEVGAYATYQVGDRTDMYRVDVAWGDMTFTYTEAAEIWDPVAHEWKATETGVWAPSAADANKVTMTNHSSLPVTIALSFADDATDADVITGAFDKETVSLAAVSGEGAGATIASDVAYLTLSGKFTNETTANVVLGTVTAAIN